MESINTLIGKIQERRGDWPRLARESEVSYSWLVKFAGGKIENPRIQTIQRLSDALSPQSPVVLGGDSLPG